MAKLDSVPGFPAMPPVPTNLVLNKTSSGKFQIARVRQVGASQDFDILCTCDTDSEAREFARAQIEKDFPGLLNQIQI